jgi:Fur family ferric uptake transcriptional regulator
MKSMEEYEQMSVRFREYLTRNGLNLTSQRCDLLRFIIDGLPHFDIEEMVATVRKKHAEISRATIYRNISHMEKAGLVRRMDFDENHAHFEIVTEGGHHEHLVCDTCGAIIEFTDEELENRISITAERHGFRMTNHNVRISGICNKCGNKAKEPVR